jgi:hypothetical protein
MPDTPHPSRQAAQEAAFGRAFPELADASTAQIREMMAVARGAALKIRREQRRVDALQAWLAENALPLPFPEAERRSES